ncbi:MULTISPECIES: phage tail protein [Pontibacillus]|uniref:Phage tail protein n=1 Tax=Pontibacillus chungwhensis TaxID=265426 RepID=A0ABY8UZC9_9BACI|nr:MULTISPECIES: phage tail protein [Pontibacillus]MCD5324773.1 phage tail protein [Pontibacillus sp. HN14]WIF98733.1 phage tail protein [Pontibacillus chungwhensis]
MRVDIATDRRALRNIERRLGALEKKAPNVLSKSLNRAATNAKKNVSVETRKKYRLSAAKIKETMNVKRANYNSLSASIITRGNLIGLDHFKVSPSEPRHHTPPRSLKAGVEKGSLKKIPGAFVANAGNGNFVFQRQGNAQHKSVRSGGRVIQSQLPIRRLFGPSVPQMVGNEETMDVVRRNAQEMYDRTIDHEIERMLRR